MRRIVLLIAIVGIFTSGFAIIPGFTKSNYGANFLAFPPLGIYGFDAYYTEGNQLYSQKDLFNVYGFTGLESSIIYVGLDGVKIGYSLGIPLKVVVPYEKFPIKLFGRVFKPAFVYQAEIKYDSLDGMEFSTDDFYLTLITKTEGQKYMGIYFWPIPFIVGFDVFEF